jgi:hypothetical protein
MLNKTKPWPKPKANSLKQFDDVKWNHTHTHTHTHTHICDVLIGTTQGWACP